MIHLNFKLHSILRTTPTNPLPPPLSITHAFPKSIIQLSTFNPQGNITLNIPLKMTLQARTVSIVNASWYFTSSTRNDTECMLLGLTPQKRGGRIVPKRRCILLKWIFITPVICDKKAGTNSNNEIVDATIPFRLHVILSK